MSEELWANIRDIHVAAPAPHFFTASLPDEDDDVVDTLSDPPSWDLTPLAGYCCIIQYQDSRGRPSERRITCNRIEATGMLTYVQAFCHERARPRAFRTDRIIAVVDIHTGEVWEPGADFFDRYMPNRIQESGLTWGLSVSEKASLSAALNTLRFMANCDGSWHPAERETIEDFIAAYWMRAEHRGDPPIDDIMQAVDRMAPDPATFFAALGCCADHPVISPIIRRTLAQVIAADGVTHAQEFLWGSHVDEFFASR